MYEFCCWSITGSLPPSPADSGVSDVDSSSSGGQPACSEELKARLTMPPHCSTGGSSTSGGQTNGSTNAGHLPHGTFLHPNFYHNSPPLRSLWNSRSVSCKWKRCF